MKLTLEGISAIYKEDVEKLIYSIIKRKFALNSYDYITEISIPIKSKINELTGSTIKGKSYSSKGCSRIYLNPIIYEQGVYLKNETKYQTQCAAIFHELVHAETYYKLFNNSRLSQFYQGFADALYFWDEYFAVKETAGNFPRSVHGYFKEFIELISKQNVGPLNDKSIEEKTNSYTKEVLRQLSSVFGIIDGRGSKIGELFKESVNNSFSIGLHYLELWNTLRKVDDLPNKNELINIDQYIQEIKFLSIKSFLAPKLHHNSTKQSKTITKDFRDSNRFLVRAVGN